MQAIYTDPSSPLPTADQIQGLPSPTVRARRSPAPTPLGRRRGRDIHLLGRASDRTPHRLRDPHIEILQQLVLIFVFVLVQPGPETTGSRRDPRVVRRPGRRVQEAERRGVGIAELAQDAERQDLEEGSAVPETGGQAGQVVNLERDCPGDGGRGPTIYIVDRFPVII